MKIILFSIALLFVFSHSSLAQKGKVNEAINAYKDQELDKAKAAIDLAIQNDQTKSSDKAWYYRALIYRALYNHPKYKSLCDQCLETAFESFNKLNELNPKNEWVDIIKVVWMDSLMRNFFDRGVNEFNTKNYKNALESFEMVQKLAPHDTTVILNSALAATQAHEYDKAKQYYNRLLSLNYKDIGVYQGLTKIYLESHDTVHALQTVMDARKQFPDSITLLNNQIDILLTLDRNKEATDLINEAIHKEPQNTRLYFVLGVAYDRIANPKDAEGKDLPKPINYTEYMTKIEQAFQRGLQVNANDYLLNYFLGLFYFNQGAELFNAANNIKSQIEYEKAKEKFDRVFKTAQPYLEKALQLNPRKSADDNDNYAGTISSLKQLYARTNQTDKYKELEAK